MRIPEKSYKKEWRDIINSFILKFIMFDSITDFILSIYTLQSHKYSLSSHELLSSIVTLLILFFIGIIILVFTITTIFLLVKLYRCNEQDEEAMNYDDSDSYSIDLKFDSKSD